MATTIASYNVFLSLKTGGFLNESRLTRLETDSLKRTLRSISTDADRYEKHLNNLTNAYEKGAISLSRYMRAKAALNDQFKSLNGHISAFGSAFGRTVAAIGAAAGGLTFGKLVKDSTMLAANFEATSIQFEVLLKSREKADSMLASLREFASKSPLTTEQAQQAAKTMMAFGVETEAILPAIKRLGDISLGNADRFQSLALVFGQVRSAGRLMGQDLLQFVNAGFNPLQMMAEKMAKQLGGLSSQYMPELKKQMEDGQISFAMVEQAIKEATDAGGLFAGMTERIGETSLGKLAQLQDKFQQLGIRLGNELLPIFNDMLDKASRLLDRLEQTGNTPRAWADFGNVAAAGIGDVTKIVTEGNTWQERSKLFNQFMSDVNPWKSWGPTKQITPVDQMPKPGFFENVQIQTERQMMRDANRMRSDINRSVKDAPEKQLEAQKQALKEQQAQKELQRQNNQLLMNINKSIQETRIKQFK